MIVFAVEPLEQVWDEFVALAEQHWKETQGYRHGQPFCLSFERYNAYAKVGWYLQFTARDQGRLVGYGGVYIVPSMHTQQLIATEDSWYLAPEYRKGWNAVRFFRFMEQEGVKRGVVESTLTTPTHLKSGLICERLGYKPVATVYNKQYAPSKVGV